MSKSKSRKKKAPKRVSMVATLIGCGFRRAELLALQLESIQQREDHWVIADLIGKGGHVRTVRIPLGETPTA